MKKTKVNRKLKTERKAMNRLTKKQKKAILNRLIDDPQIALG